MSSCIVKDNSHEEAFYDTQLSVSDLLFSVGQCPLSTLLNSFGPLFLCKIIQEMQYLVYEASMYVKRCTTFDCNMVRFPNIMH